MKKNYWPLVLCCLLITGAANAQHVGIGTSDPKIDLHIDGGLSVFTGILLTSTASGSTYADGLHLGMQYQSDAPGNRYGYLMLQENAPFRIGTNGSEIISLSSTGNVGIGYTNPTLRLEVNGDRKSVV